MLTTPTESGMQRSAALLRHRLHSLPHPVTDAIAAVGRSKPLVEYVAPERRHAVLYTPSDRAESCIARWVD
jgi:hypothetical protein